MNYIINKSNSFNIKKIDVTQITSLQALYKEFSFIFS